tara:strand:- start:4774 stop:5619 length:846 start_codon:yes stop_codon:yes gene_type:complete
MSDITVCIITNGNYSILNKCIFGLRRKFVASKIAVVDITPIPNPIMFPDGVHQYIIAKPRTPESISKGLLLEIVQTSHMLFVSDSFNANNMDISKYATPMSKMIQYKLPTAQSLLAEYPIFNTAAHPNPNNKQTGGVVNGPLEFFEVTDGTRIRPTIREEEKVRAAAVKKQRLKVEYKEPSNKDKNRLVGLWLDLKTNFVYKINVNGSAAFCNVPKINVKPHRWRKTIDGEIEIINSEQARFIIDIKNKNEIVIKPLGKTDFDFHHIGKNIPERTLVRRKL